MIVVFEEVLYWRKVAVVIASILFFLRFLVFCHLVVFYHNTVNIASTFSTISRLLIALSKAVDLFAIICYYLAYV